MWKPDPATIITAEMKATAARAALVVAVKVEAERRIIAIMPEFKQRNSLALFAETAQTYGVDPAGWPAELQAINNSVMAAWGAIKAIRIASDRIEAMDPIPADYADDKWWTSA